MPRAHQGGSSSSTVGEEGGLSEGGTCSSGYVQELLQQQRRQQQQQQEAGRPSSSSGGSSNNPYSSSCADSVAQGPVGCGEMHVLQEQQQGGHFSRKRGCGEDAPKALQQQQQQQQQQSSQSGPWLEQRTGPDGIAITFIVMGSDPEGPTLAGDKGTHTHTQHAQASRPVVPTSFASMAAADQPASQAVRSAPPAGSLSSAQRGDRPPTSPRGSKGTHCAPPPSSLPKKPPNAAAPLPPPTARPPLPVNDGHVQTPGGSSLYPAAHTQQGYLPQGRMRADTAGTAALTGSCGPAAAMVTAGGGFGSAAGSVCGGGEGGDDVEAHGE